MAAQKFSIPNTTSAIWAEPANLNAFLETPIEPDTAGGIINEQTNVKAHTRRQYVGDDTTINVAAHTRDFMVDPGRRNGSALPGDPFIADDGIERRQMRYTGTWMDVHAFFLGGAALPMDLYSPSGTRYIITPEVP